MGTKSTVCGGDDFHLYKEEFNTTDVFLSRDTSTLKSFKIDESGLDMPIILIWINSR